jgi:ribosomal protein S18 acetylase RimI-like enzyme
VASALTSQPLSSATWPAFARLVEKHNGIFGGCWCISFHLEPGENKRMAGKYRELKEARGRGGRAHAALVFEGCEAVGWCQFGPTGELPNIRSKKEYEKGLRELPDWRITCFFIDRQRRGEGIASIALREALRYIAQAGGGTVEAYPEDYTGERTSNSFLCSGTLGMFERAGFRKMRKIALRRWVVAKKVPPTRATRPSHRSAAPHGPKIEPVHPIGRRRSSAFTTSTVDRSAGKPRTAFALPIRSESLAVC